jgi:hypothetical protein
LPIRPTWNGKLGVMQRPLAANVYGKEVALLDYSPAHIINQSWCGTGNGVTRHYGWFNNPAAYGQT